MVAAFASLASGVFLYRSIGRHMMDREARRLLLEARRARDLYAASPSPEAADALARHLAGDLPARVSFLDSTGRILGEGGEPAQGPLEGSLGDRPEVKDALRTGQGRALGRGATGEDSILYVALRVDPTDPGRGVVRIALPLTAVRLLQAKMRAPMLGATLVCLLSAALLGWLAARRLSLQLEAMSRTATEIASGSTAARAGVEGNDEVARLARSLNRMADQLDQRLSLLARERNQLAQLLDGMVEGVVLTDAGGRIVVANRAFERIFGTSSPLQGLRPLEAARVPALQEAVEQALQAGEPATREIVLPGEPEKVLRASLSAIREGARTVGAVAVFHDVTELKALEKVRREFVANVSHELRTPLTAIRGYAETLKDGSVVDPGKVSGFAEVIHRHARRLQALIEDLLDLSSVEQGKATMSVGSVSLRDPVGQAEAVVGPAAASKRLAFSIAVPADLPPLRADRDRLAQVLINLLDNAVKFTPEQGRVELSASASDGRMTIEISDTGIGIPPEDLPRIFERFYRVDRSRDRREGGTGLGLAIAKHLTLGMGGTLDVQSVSGSGTTFRLTFPLA